MKKTILFLMLVLSISSCSNLKQVETEELDKETEIFSDVKSHAVADFNAISTFEVDKQWWEDFNDPALNNLINQVITQNIDLKLIVKRIDLARLAVEDTDFDKIPKVNASISQPGGISSENSAYTSHSKLSTHLSWEADIWGRIEAASRGAESALKATEAEYRGAYLKVINDMANIYFNIRMLDEQRDLHEWAIKDTNEILRLYIEREKVGLTNKKRSASQKAEVLRLQSDLINIERQREIFILQLNLLLGNAPHEINPDPTDLTKSIKIPTPPRELNFDLISRRPDVVAADYRLREAYYNEESARVARLPKLSVGLDYSMSGTSMASMTDNWVLSVLPRISFPSLDPATRVELERRGVFVEIKQDEYKKALLEAVSDVEEAVLNIKYRHKQLETEKERMDQLELSYTKVMKRFETGVISHLEVLEASRTLINSRQRYLDNYREVLAQTAHMYIALGGGW